MTIKTIGSTGDYSTINAWEADAPATLTAPWEGRLQNQEFYGGDGSGAAITISGSTSDATNHKILTADTGASFRDHANKLTNPLRYNAAVGAAVYIASPYNIFTVSERHVEIRNLQIKHTNSERAIAFNNCNGYELGNWEYLDNCILESTGNNTLGVSQSNLKASNCLIINRTSGSKSAIHWTYVRDSGGAFNCTLVSPSDVSNTAAAFTATASWGNPIVKNCALFGFSSAFSGTAETGSGYNATDDSSAPGSSNQVSATYADQFENTTNAASDFRAKA